MSVNVNTQTGDTGLFSNTYECIWDAILELVHSLTSDLKIKSLVVTCLALILATQAPAPQRQINNQMKFYLCRSIHSSYT